jgi:hypothetical protein
MTGIRNPVPCYSGYDLAMRTARERWMIASFLVLMLLGIGFVMLWIAWWLLADLFSGMAPPAAARIETMDARRRSTIAIKRRVAGH